MKLVLGVVLALLGSGTVAYAEGRQPVTPRPRDPLQWVAMGNGGGYVGIPRPQPQGPFFLIDPAFECPAGTSGPLVPGYREELRFDHWGPAGCTGNACTELVYARQDSCGGAASFVTSPSIIESTVYRMHDGAVRGFALGTFDGHVYRRQQYAPDPVQIPRKVEAYCRGPWSAKDGLTYEIVIELKEGKALASLFRSNSKDPEAAKTPMGYSLGQISDLPVTRSGRSYSTQGLELNVDAATLTLQPNGQDVVIALSCWTN